VYTFDSVMVMGDYQLVNFQENLWEFIDAIIGLAFMSPLQSSERFDTTIANLIDVSSSFSII